MWLPLPPRLGGMRAAAGGMGTESARATWLARATRRTRTCVRRNRERAPRSCAHRRCPVVSRGGLSTGSTCMQTHESVLRDCSHSPERRGRWAVIYSLSIACNRRVGQDEKSSFLSARGFGRGADAVPSNEEMRESLYQGAENA